MYGIWNRLIQGSQTNRRLREWESLRVMNKTREGVIYRPEKVDISDEEDHESFESCESLLPVHDVQSLNYRTRLLFCPR